MIKNLFNYSALQFNANLDYERPESSPRKMVSIAGSSIPAVPLLGMIEKSQLLDVIGVSKIHPDMMHKLFSLYTGDQAVTADQFGECFIVVQKDVANAYRDEKYNVLFQPYIAERSGVTAISATRNEIPDFPRAITQFINIPGRDFWNKPVNERGQVRTFGNDEWQGIHKFPNTMNGCHNGVFLLRWRSAGGPVLSAVGYSPKSAHFKALQPASYGYMYGTNCQQPLFKSMGNGINNVIYEIRFFQASV